MRFSAGVLSLFLTLAGRPRHPYPPAPITIRPVEQAPSRIMNGSSRRTKVLDLCRAASLRKVKMKLSSVGVLFVLLTLVAAVHAVPIRPFGRLQVVETVYTEAGPGDGREGSGLEPDSDVFIRPARPDNTGNEVETVLGNGWAGLSPAQQCREQWGRALMECFHDYRRAMNDLGELLLSSEGQTLFCGVQMELYQCYQTVLDQPFCEYDNEISTRQTKIQTDMRLIDQKCTGFR